MRDGGTRSGQSSELPFRIALLTGGDDKPYALGLASALTSHGISLDFIGSDEIDGPQLHTTPQVTFLNLRGDQRRGASLPRKALRVLAYYVRLIRYAARAQAKVFHVLWNNKFELFDRIVLMVYYRSLGKRIVFTAHNVNARRRDSNDSWLNRLTLRCQYHLAHHIFVHTGRAKTELRTAFHVPERKVSVIPIGINTTVPNSGVTSNAAKRSLGINRNDKTMLFFGNIAPYKGLEYLIDAMAEVTRKCGDYRLIIAGKPKQFCANYCNEIQEMINRRDIGHRIIVRMEYIPEENVELYFKAADVLILPYVHIYQSGVLVLAYSFGLPVIAADVGSLKEDIIHNKTGFVFQARDPVDLAKTIEAYFASELYGNLDNRRQEIRHYARERHSWTKVGEMTKRVYANLLQE